jgi:hypothetical protein
MLAVTGDANIATGADLRLNLSNLSATDVAALRSDIGEGNSRSYSVLTTTGAISGGGFDDANFTISDYGSFLASEWKFEALTTANTVEVEITPLFDASILVTNLAEPFRSATPISNPQYWAAQSFSPDAQRYALTSVEAVVGNSGGSPGIVAELRRANTNGDIDQTPEGLLSTFTAPDMTGDPAARLFTPNAAVTLEPGTKYWFVLGNTDTGTFDWSYADTNNTLGPGTLANYGDTSDAGVTWDYRGSEFPYFIQVRANVVGGPFLDADADENGVVDGNDLTVWTAGFGTEEAATHMQGDADADGDVDGADFMLWQQQLGNGVAMTTQGVPEPATLALLLALAVSVAAFCPRFANRGALWSCALRTSRVVQ